MADINDINAAGDGVCDDATLLHPAPGVWLRQAIDNMGWIDLGGRLAVVDTLEQPELEDEIFANIAESTEGLPVEYVLNTHQHIDHVALNPAFEKRMGSRIVSQRTGGVPTGGVRRLEGAARTVEMVHLPGCHTPEDCVVWVPDAAVLFTGDLFGWGLVPYNGNLRKGQADLIRHTYRKLIDYKAKTVVPGHGPVCGVEELERWLVYFDWLAARLREAVDAHLELDEALRLTPPPEDMRHWWRFAAWKHADSVKKVYKAVKRGWI